MQITTGIYRNLVTGEFAKLQYFDQDVYVGGVGCCKEGDFYNIDAAVIITAAEFEESWRLSVGADKEDYEEWEKRPEKKS